MMEMINGNVDVNYLFPKEESHLYHVGLVKRMPLGNMQFEEIKSVQKFEPKEFERFEKFGAKAYQQRNVLHNPMKVTKMVSDDIPEKKVIYDDRTREEIITILKDADITWKGNLGNDKLIKLYQNFKGE